MLGYNQMLDCVIVKGAAWNGTVAPSSIHQHSISSVFTQQPLHMELLPGLETLTVGKNALVNPEELLELGLGDQHDAFA